MHISPVLSLLIALCLFCDVLIIFATIPHDSISISCGSSGNKTAPDGRVWIGDSALVSSSTLQINGNPSNRRAIHKLTLPDSTPYITARISRHAFSYVFPVNPGHKFIRLHFNHDSYKGFERSKPIFTVKAGPFTLLSTINSALNSHASGVKQVKEYCVNIEDDQGLTITFSPAQKTKKSDDFYAFVNGIEVVSMRTGLYFTPEGELGARVVGQKYRFYIDNSTALETVQRLNVGGASISPAEDSRMFRNWDEDSRYMMEKGDISTNIITDGYRGTKTYIAPIKVYQTARSMYTDRLTTLHNLTWKIPGDLGFRYLIRLHFSEFQAKIGESGNIKFFIVVNNQIVEDSADVVQSGGASGEPAYRDYILMMEGDKMVGKRNLTIGIQPMFESGGDEHFHCTLNGLEVFKLSNPDNSLAGVEPFPKPQSSTSTKSQKRKQSVHRRNLIATMLTVILALLNIAVYHLRRSSDSNSGMRVRRSTEHSCRLFSVDEIRSSTDNFNPELHIGSGGYGRVYKGAIDGGATVVAIKRLRLESRQGDNEFWTEIKMLSRIRHQHLVPLIGYCNDGQERLLVYQYMNRGTFGDHLFKNRHGKSNPPLPWELRLKVSIGAARGLYYLHSRHRVIHRDVKSSNILLDENWVAKISDFGLSKMGPTNDSFTHVSTNVKGTFGYLDPEYFLTRKLTRKSDVYAFGVVLFEVLSGRLAIDLRLEEEQHSLAGWARYCIREGKVDRLIDESLMEQISPACLKVFVGIAGRCLHTQPHGRPAMADVVMGLELALALQQNQDPEEQVEDQDNAGRIYSDHSDGVISMDDVSLSPPNGESERMNSEDIPSSGPRNRGIDQRSGKAKTRESSSNGITSPWWDPFGILPRTPSKSRASSMPPQVVINQFSLQEIQKATNGFHNSLVIGFGGWDNVYKGYIDGGQKVVAIRWSRTTDSRLSLARELQTKKEIQMKSSPSQQHVTFLIGYCETESDMMLVYDYSTKGTLHDHLHDRSKDPLPWKRRLQICIGAARGLSYLHSIVKQTMLHRDLRSTNIWLDENWTSKVSDWGLSSKKGNNRAPSTARGNWAYLDSDFIRGEELTQKSLVFSFGLLLFEVLIADKEGDRWLDEDQVSIAQWIKSCMRSNLSGSIDPFLVGRTSPDSLRLYIETAGRCLLDHGMDRPSMTDVIMRLEAALKQQEAAEGNKGSQPRRS